MKIAFPLPVDVAALLYYVTYVLLSRADGEKATITIAYNCSFLFRQCLSSRQTPLTKMLVSSEFTS